MGFNTRVILHLAGLLFTLCLLTWCIVNTTYYATMLTLALVLALQAASLLRTVNSTNRQLARFLLAIRHADFSQSFRNTGTDSSFRELGSSFDTLIERFRLERSDKEGQAAYLHALVEQIPTALLALSEDGRISLCNRAFRHMLDRQELNQLSQVEAFSSALADALKKVQPGIEHLLELPLAGETQFLTLSCSILRSGGAQQKLISIQNIQNTLDAREMQAWQNLIRVMTHEIMNSITPITSLSDTAKQLVSEARELVPGSTNAEASALLEDADSAIQTIGNRSQGLMRFVDSYRTLSRLPTPKFRAFRAEVLFKSALRLMQEQAVQAGIKFTSECHPVTVEITADQDMLEQALINILKNAIEALGETTSPTIHLKASLLARHRIEIEIRDNGCGMDEESLDNLFIPFYTTKRGGSGIGMSVVRQIVKLNEGVIRVSSQPDEGTAVVLVFQAGQ